MSTYQTEREMYPDVGEWLQSFLSARFPRGEVGVWDTHKSDLNRLISARGLQGHFDSDVWRTYEIRTDVTAFLRHRKARGLVFVECKLRAISLRDLSQLLGYCRIARPLLAFLISPVGAGGSLRSLVSVYGRSDVLEYDWPKGKMARSIVVAKWNRASRDLDMTTVLPLGAAGKQPW